MIDMTFSTTLYNSLVLWINEPETKSLKDCLKLASKTYSKSKSASSSVTRKSKKSKKGTRKARKTKKSKKGKKSRKGRK